MPGSEFGRDEKELTARIAYVDFNSREALDNYPIDKAFDDSFVKTYCARTIEAVGRLMN
ncbi:MAG: hypothetical protein KJP19_02960 [Deltaproteobacteria bacterium]|nr:hypothetical protein [Deltaproteobacteria bacterium]MBT8360212.1 hypothetical protein [Deltaproteobacteria bacterium]